MQLEIVSHCWHYAPQLTYQLSSLVLFPPERCNLTMTVWASLEDASTQAVLNYFAQCEVPRVTWSFKSLPMEQLFRRGIGRNLSASATAADWIWFADVDMCFREKCLDLLGERVAGSSDDLVFPRTIRISATHEDGDRLLDAVREAPRVVDIDESPFVDLRYSRAIGGVQIVRGDTARRFGYCRDSPRHQRPLRRWQRTYEDVAFRRSLPSGGKPIDLPGLFRIRHRRHGRRDELGNLQNKVENVRKR